jgi:hypothetical protein
MNFLVTEDFDFDFEEVCNKFIRDTFPNHVDDISVRISYSDNDMFTPMYKESVFVQIMFNQYSWVNNLGNERTESVGIDLQNNGLKPFYIDGKFKTMDVYEVCSLYPIQKNDTIYGMEKQLIMDMFEAYIANC